MKYCKATCGNRWRIFTQARKASDARMPVIKWSFIFQFKNKKQKTNFMYLNSHLFPKIKEKMELRYKSFSTIF